MLVVDLTLDQVSLQEAVHWFCCTNTNSEIPDFMDFMDFLQVRDLRKVTRLKLNTQLNIICITMAGNTFKWTYYMTQRKQVQGKQHRARNRTLGNTQRLRKIFQKEW